MSTKTPARVRELRTALETKTADLEGMSRGWKVEDNGGLVMSTDDHAAFVKTVRDAEEIKGLLDIEETAAGLRDYLSAPEGSPLAARDAAQSHNARPEVKSLGDVLVESKRYQEIAERVRKGEMTGLPSFAVSADRGLPEMKAAALMAEQKDIFNLSGGSVSHQALGGIQTLGIAEQRRRQARVRDLFPKAQTTAAVLYGVRETGWTNNARQVPQRVAADGVSPATGGPSDIWGRKPKSKLTLTPVMYPVATIAHTIDVHTSILADEPRLRNFINTRMVDGVMYAEDETLLFGAPGGEQITGIANTPGVQAYTGVNSDKYSVQLRRAATRAMLAEYDPTAVVLHPLDWEDVEVEEDSTGAFRVAIAVAVGAERRVWRLDIIATTAMHEGMFMLGAFGMGAQFYDREAVNVVVSTENNRNIEDNIVTIRAEERAALEVPRPESFVIGTFTTYVAP